MKLSVYFLFSFSIFTLHASDLEVTAIIKHVDELYRSESSYAEIEMHIQTSHWERKLSLNAWTEKMEKTFIRILSPKKEKGTTTLRIGNEMWNYLPNVNKVIKIPPSMMMGSWMGSDFTNDDLVKESSMLTDYTHSMLNSENGESSTDQTADLYYLELLPKEDKPVVWSRIILAVRKSDYIPVWEKFYNERMEIVRILRFKEIISVGDRQIPCILEMTPVNKPGNITTIRYNLLKFDINLPEETFSLRNLRSKPE